MKRGVGISVIILLSTVFLFSCSAIQINPSNDVSVYKNLGRDVGTHLKATKDDVWLAKSKKWAEDALLLTDEELLTNNIIQVAYEKLLEKYPDKADRFFMAKSFLTVMGVSVNLDTANLLPDERLVYLKCARALLQGYLDVIIVKKLNTK